MAEGMDDGEFWLPSEFLTDDFFLEGEVSDSKAERGTPGDGRSDMVLCEFPNELGSNLSSPVESAAETESDEEDYHLAGLTRQMAHAFLQDNDVDEDGDEDDSSRLARDHPKVGAMARSPQSTLCDVGIWTGSNKGSPPSTHFERRTAAAGQVSLTEQQKVHGRGLLAPPAKLSPSIPAAYRNTSCSNGFYSGPLLTQQQLQAERFYQLKQQQLMKQQLSAAWYQSRGKCGDGGGGHGRLPSSAWPQQQGSGMRAVFLTGTGARRESSGTGVFLPRRPGNPTDERKEPACSTVLLPDRVIQALNLNLDDMGNALLARQKRNRNRPVSTAHEHRLPAEWTY